MFDPDNLDDLLGANDSPTLPDLSEHHFDELCDRLFTGEAPDWTASDEESKRAFPPRGGTVARSVAALSRPTVARTTDRMETVMSNRFSAPKKTTSPTEKKPRRNWPAVWLTMFVLLGGLCFWNGFSGHEPKNASAPATADTTPRPQYITKDIADIREGDIVLARDEFGNDLGLKRVVEVYGRTSDHLRILTFRAADGTEQTLKTTDEHPLWIEGHKSFVEAKDLAIGDKVSGPNGETQWLASTTYEPHPEGIPVYNFQVEDYHTYFVAEHGARAPPVLVHNADYVPDAPKGAVGDLAEQIAGPGQRLAGQIETVANMRPFVDRLKDATANPSRWKVVRSISEASTNLRNKGGRSLQEILRNEETGETIIRHTLLKPDGTIFEPAHFREFLK
jgi:hypothetical protein